MAAPETFGTSGLPFANTPSALPLTKGMGLVINASVPFVALDPINNIDLISQDGPVAGTKPIRYGKGRDISVTNAAGLWLNGPDGESVWVVDVVSPGAIGIRLHLTNVNLPAGAQLVAYAPNLPGFVAGPYSGRGVLDTGEVWTPTTFEQTVRIEFKLPKGAPRELAFTIDRLQHVYRDRANLPVNEGAEEVGTCHNDSTCSPAWANTSRAVAGIGSISGADALYCTGTLINSQNADQTPYWLTANHCLSTEAAANSGEFFWLYQTATCNGAAPTLSNSPRSSVATLVSNNSASDYCLLMIRGSLPSGMFWAGWTGTAAANGTPVTGIHHPSGSWKRISFGTKTSDIGGSWATNHIKVNWSSGVTEPGSSGSPVFRNDTQQIIGQLHGGPSACGVGVASLTDDYGRFAVTYANSAVAVALAGGSDDNSEPNNTCAVATVVSAAGGSLTGRIVKSTAEDYYKLDLPIGNTITFTLSNITNAYGSIASELRNGCGTAILASSAATTGTQVLTWTNSTGAVATVNARVFMASSVRNTYDIAWSISAPPSGPANDNCANATVMLSGANYTGSTTSATNDGTASCGASTTSKDVWFTYTAPAAGTLAVNSCASNFDSVLAAFTGCPTSSPGSSPTQLACNDDAATGVGPCPGTTQSFISFAVTANTNYKIRLGGYNGATGNYAVAATFTPTVVPTTPPNDTCAGAIALASGTVNFNTTNATSEGFGETLCNFFGSNLITNDVWYRYTATCTGTVTATTCTMAGFDTKLAAYSSCPAAPDTTILACNDDTACSGVSGTRSTITFASTAGQSYLVRIGGYNGAKGTGTLTTACVPSGMVACNLADVAGDSLNTTRNPNGSVGAEDLDAFISGFISGIIAIADIASDSLDTTYNPNGSVGSEDLDAFISAFIAGC